MAVFSYDFPAKEKRNQKNSKKVKGKYDKESTVVLDDDWTKLYFFWAAGRSAQVNFQAPWSICQKHNFSERPFDQNKKSSRNAPLAAFRCSIYPCRSLGRAVAQPSAIGRSQHQVMFEHASGHFSSSTCLYTVFAGDREVQAMLRELDAAVADMAEELPELAVI
jgi:hypothetical protein